MRRYVKDRGWRVALEIKDVGSGAQERPQREDLLKAARKREIDLVLVWKLDRWGRSLVDLVTTLQELSGLGVGFISLTEALDLTTPTGRAMTGLLAVFAEFEREILRERVKAGIAHARSQGRVFGRPKTAALQAEKIRKLKREGMNHSAIARTLKIGRTSVRRALEVGGSRAGRSTPRAP
jgi:DNA invertase Pin-like site-specific DNA recombinase